MGLTLGDGLTVLSVCGLLITLIVTVFQRYKKGDGDGTPNSRFCPEHINLATGQAKIKGMIEGLSSSVEEIKDSQTSLHKRLDGFINRFVKI